MRNGLSVLKRTAVAVLLAASPALSRGADFALVLAGKCPEEIVIDAEAPTMVHYAAQELGDYLVKIRGTRSAVVLADEQWQLPPGKSRRIFIGESAFSRGMGIVSTGLRPDGFIVAVGEKNLVLVGRDEPVPYVENNVPDWQRLYVICKPGALACVRLQGAQGYSCWFDEVTVAELPADWQRRAHGIPSYP